MPIANPETVDRLLGTAVDIAREQSIPILGMYVCEVQSQVPLSMGDRTLSDEESELVDYATERGAEFDVDFEVKTRYARDTATGIVGSVDAYDGSALLMGWRGRPRRRDIVLGSLLDRVLAEAPCDVYVQRVKEPRNDPGSILVPVVGGPHDELGAELAGVIASQHDATITLLHVDRSDGVEQAEKSQAALFRERRGQIPDGIAVDERIVESDHVAGAVSDATTDYDLTVLGATRETFLNRKLVGSVAQGAGRTAGTSVIVTRKHVEE
jgi:nucleotide-binding universal stress UspA family protein